MCRWCGSVQGLPVQSVQPYGGLQGPRRLRPAGHLLPRPPRPTRSIARCTRSREVRSTALPTRACSFRVACVVRLLSPGLACLCVSPDLCAASGSAPTPSPAGLVRSPIVCSATMAKSTRSGKRTLWLPTQLTPPHHRLTNSSASSFTSVAYAQRQHQPHAGSAGRDAQSAVL